MVRGARGEGAAGSGRALRLIDVAERAGVSLATASRSLRGREGVSDRVALHVRAVAAEMGYVANPHASTLAGGVTRVAGLIVYEIGDPYFSEIASGALRVAGEHGWSVQISHTAREPHAELAQIRLLRAHRVGAIVMAGSGYVDRGESERANRELLDYQGSGGRVAVIGRHHLRCDAVLPDNRAAGETIAGHLLALGHRAIAVAAGPAHLTTVEDRLLGIRRALAAHGVDPADVPVVPGAFTREGGRAGTERILSEHPGTTAIVALNDAMATGVLSVLRERGIPVPGRVSVVGFDDIQVAQDLSPALTTVALPMADMGAAALEMVLRPHSARPRRKATGHRLRVRDSTAPAPTAT
ncbi:LacI family DNA-binding transcriptional regulator [Streptomyces radicis]|uniref:LacI family transcriptional regulator n=1 Tax=Streptomyces radicis TaxID=1750517 RepID=A0A3A9VUR1_9ACTN|nr:LacI family DNA-binding transcriptional regulator [Streptomyces radicis]RKN04745.1 LacI family transcriptional regulator [Streptomyces radicis]RKN15951.1 LacI family transcriptional regulator [Streptomyces radicis]